MEPQETSCSHVEAGQGMLMRYNKECERLSISGLTRFETTVPLDVG